mmetsp:Transcript_5246/g.10719  ORF Transcript_5246/g.10719 Transcript_5246/m.10719 type:complete len:150 (-) Transcript_5246:52-501(-)
MIVGFVSSWITSIWRDCPRYLSGVREWRGRGGRVSGFGVDRVRMSMSGGKDPTQMTDEDWKQVLSPEEFRVLREKGTERAGTGEYDKMYPVKGHFKCAGCGNPLYSAQSKFNSGCGWPAFDKCYQGSLKVEVDRTWGMTRTEIMYVSSL